MNQDPWLLLSDVDGTALQAREGIPPQNPKAVRRFVEKGGRFTFATGRNLRVLQMASGQFAVNAPVIVLNGAILYDLAEDRAIRSTPLPASVREVCGELVARYDGKAAVMAVGEEIYYALTNSPGSLKISSNLITTPQPGAMDTIVEPLYKLLIATGDAADTPAVRAWAGERYGGEYNVMNSGAHLVELVRKGVSKGRAMLEAADLLGIPHARTAAIGDGENDAEMLRAAAFSAAPADAAELAREAAQMVVCPCMEGALAAFVGLLEKKAVSAPGNGACISNF